MNVFVKRIFAITVTGVSLSVFPAASISEIVGQMKNAIRENVDLPDDTTITDFVQYCREWADEAKIDSNGIVLRTDTPLIKISARNLHDISLFDVLELGCISSYHFFTVDKGGYIYVYPNVPEYIEEREWINTKGKKLKAKWVGCADGNADEPIFMTVPNGKLIKIDIKKLSAKDRRYLQESRLRKQKVPYARKNGRWMSPVDIYIDNWNIKEDQYIATAKKLIFDKSYVKGVHYKVFQILEIGTLCLMGKQDLAGHITYYGGEIFLNLGLKKGRVASDEEFINQVPLYWVGTYTYPTRGGDDRTVNVYDTCSLESAIFMVRSLQGLYETGDARFDSDVPKDSGKESSSLSQKGDELQIAGFGSGFFITRDGYFVTNYHVVKNVAKTKVRIGTELIEAKLVKTDKETDLALLKVDGDGSFEAVEFAPNRQENLGQSVFTMGYPQPDIQGVTPKVTKGIISGLEGFKGDVRKYQIDASIQPGNSGGPVADANGYIVGIVVSSLVRGTSGEIPQNVNYAIKKSYLLAFLDSVLNCGASLQCPSSETARDFILAVRKIEKSCALVVVYK